MKKRTTITSDIFNLFRMDKSCFNRLRSAAKTLVYQKMISAGISLCLVMLTFQAQGQYCAAGGSAGSSDDITNVTFHTINNNSSVNTLVYEDFTSISTTVERGNTYAFSATISTVVFNMQIIAWIDFNQDSDFTDAGEQVFIFPSFANVTSVQSGYITIPPGATLGNTRMRVRLHRTTVGPNSTPCGNSSVGQVEDYTINIADCTSVISNPGNTVSSVPPPVCIASGAQSFTLSLSNNSFPFVPSYQWQSSPDNITWTNISGATNATHTVSGISEVTWYRCGVINCFGTAYSNPLQMTVQGCYCTAGSTFGIQNKITNVSFCTINNYSFGTNAYEDFTSISTTVEQGNTYLFSATIDGANAGPFEILTWIDYNRDYDFDDPGEKVFDSDLGYDGAYPANITIPGGTYIGATRMRVRINYPNYGPNTTPCGNSFNTQVEDYTVNIVSCSGQLPNPGNTTSSVAPPVCTGSGIQSFTLSMSNSTLGSVYQWQSSPDNTIWTDISGATSATYLNPGINDITWYRCFVTNCAGTAYSVPLQMTVQPCYCLAGVISNTPIQKIVNVQFNTINNTSALNSLGYEDFTNISTNIDPGGSFNLSVRVSCAYPGDQLLAWIDFNRDYDFDDPGEQIHSSFFNVSGGCPNTSTINTSIVIPSDVSNGTTRMRVRVHDTSTGANSTPCGTSTFGQVEDYTLNVVACVSPPAPGNTLSSVASPVCSGTEGFILSLQNSVYTATYQWQSSPNNSTWTNITGATDSTYNVANITSNTWYRCRVTRCGSLTTDSNPLQMAVVTAPTPGNTLSSPTPPLCPNSGFTLSLQNSTTGAAYQWQSSPDNSTWTDIPGATSATYANPGITSATWYRCQVTRCGNLTGNSNPLQMTVNTAPSPGNTLSSSTPPICPNTGFTLSLQNSTTGATYQWQSSPDNSTWTNISGETSATYANPGITSATWYRCLVTSCGGQTTESNPLQVNIHTTGPAPGNTLSSEQSVCVSTSFTLSLQNSLTGATYQWQSSPDNSTWTNISGATSATYANPGITSATWYRCRVTRCGSLTTDSNPLQITMQTCYCSAGATSTLYEKISNVTFNSINNSSASTAGYENFTAVSTNITIGNSYSLSCTISNSYTSDEVIAWIDYNQDLDFNDPGEEVFNSPTGVGPHIGLITIPCSAPTGATRMRVRMQDSLSYPGFPANSTSCGNSGYGQVEDYTVNIVAPVTYYTDNDGDGYGTGSGTAACALPPNTSANNTDCNDAATAINPGALEICNAGVDDDCDGLADNADPSVTGQTSYYTDLDGDGYGTGAAILSCTQPVNTSTNADDCDDLDIAVNPGATEVCNGGVDDDCDGLADNADPNVTGQTTWYQDADSDGLGNLNVVQMSCSQPSGYVSNSLDCNDNSTVSSCSTPTGTTVSDLTDITATLTWAANPGAQRYNLEVKLTTASTYGPAIKVYSNSYTVTGLLPGTKYNWRVRAICDSLCSINSGLKAGPTFRTNYQAYPDTDADGYGNSSVPYILIPAFPAAGYSLNNLDCNDSNNTIRPNASETCNMVDDDCDVAIDEGLPIIIYYQDTDADSYGNVSAFTMACTTPMGYVVNGSDCNDNAGSIYPGAPELCNNVDDDCDTGIDEGLNVTWYQDADGDGLGNLAVTLAQCAPPAGYVNNSLDCNDSNSSPQCTLPSGITVNPTATTATINWTSSPCVSYYSLQYRALPGGAWSPQISVFGNSTVLTGLAINTNYQYRIRSRCNAISTSTVWVLGTFITLGAMNLVEDMETEPNLYTDFTVYPNPGDGIFNIKMESPTETEVVMILTDELGKVVLKNTWSLFEGQNSYQLDLVNLASGVYQVQILQGDRLMTKKIVLMK
jgi:hypothetical protein